MGSAQTVKTPRILRLEVMPLDCGETAVVVVGVGSRQSLGEGAETRPF